MIGGEASYLKDERQDFWRDVDGGRLGIMHSESLESVFGVRGSLGCARCARLHGFAEDSVEDMLRLSDDGAANLT